MKENIGIPNPPLHFNMEPSPGSDIGDCFDCAAAIVINVGMNAVVNFEFNEVFCGVRPCDVVNPDSREIFINRYHAELSAKKSYKICYANP